MRLLSLLFFFLLSIHCFGGVERFIKPVSIKKEEYKVSAFFANKPHQSHGYLSERRDEFTQLDAGRLEAELGNMLKYRYQVDGDVVVSLTREWQPFKVSGNFLLKLNSCSPDELSPSSYLRFSVWDEGAKLGDFSIPVKVAHLKEVYFSKKAMFPGMRLNKDLFKNCKVDVLKQHANTVQANANLASFETSSSIRANSPLKWNNLTKVTLINKGKVIDVFASGNGIFVTMKGLALEDGVEGSFVKVRNLSSDKEFHAKVLNENSVKVHL